VLPRAMPTSTVFVGPENNGGAGPTVSRPALPPRLLGAHDGGAYLGVSAWALRQLVDNGKLQRVTLPGINRLLVDREDLDALIEKAKAR
jgi:hypothetical protein